MQKQNNLLFKLAQFISYILDPIFLGLLIVVVSVFRSSMPSNLTMFWIIAIIVLNLFIPILFYWYFTKQGFIFDAPLTNKRAQKERIIIFIVFLLAILVEILFLLLTKIYQPLFAVLVGGVITIFFGSIISYYWKISVHASMTTFFVAMLILLFGWSFWPAIFCLPLVFWSRLVLKRHTISQLLAGFVLSLFIVIVTFSYFGLL